MQYDPGMTVSGEPRQASRRFDIVKVIVFGVLFFATWVAVRYSRGFAGRWAWLRYLGGVLVVIGYVMAERVVEAFRARAKRDQRP